MHGEENEVKWRGVRPINGIRGVWPARNAVRVHVDGVLSGIGTAIVYTVPVGKIFFMSNMAFTTRNSAASVTDPHITVRDDSDVQQYVLLMQYEQVIAASISAQSFMPAIEVLAGWDVCIIVTVGVGRGRAYLHGWLEDA